MSKCKHLNMEAIMATEYKAIMSSTTFEPVNTPTGKWMCMDCGAILDGLSEELLKKLGGPNE